MQNQEGTYSQPEPIPPIEHVSNTDPQEQRTQSEQAPPYDPLEHPYTDGYSDQFPPHNWFQEGEKLRPDNDGKEKQNRRNVLLFGGILCLAVLLVNKLGILSTSFTWILLTLFIFAGAFVIISNWRVVTAALPVETFPVQEHPQLILNNAAGTITIHRGEQNSIMIAPTRRASGVWLSLDNMRVNYQQQRDTVTANGDIRWSPFQFSLRRIDLDITVPRNCTLQVKTGSGKIFIQDINGEITLHSGSGSIQAHALQGQLALSTGSGSVNASQLQGRIALNTGSGSMHINNITGATLLKTGSGSIEALAISGRAQFTTGSGRIQVIESRLTEETTLKTGSGSIEFSGTLDPLGNYNLHTGSGRITITLAQQTAFSLKASTGSGKVVNEFSSNEVGSAPRAQLTAKTGSGRITIQRRF
jgi:hypothetical protein